MTINEELDDRDETYGQITIGEFTILEGVADDTVWIRKKDGEGGSFSREKFERHIAEFYDKHF